MVVKKKQMEDYYERLEMIARECQDLDEGMEDTATEIYRDYSLETESGRLFYQSLNDEVLLDILREKAKELGRSPAQKEIFWVWRAYIRERFRKWPYALREAGLSKSAGRDGKPLSKVLEEREEYQALLMEVCKKAQELCRIPHPGDMPKVSQKLKKYSDKWNDIIFAAGIDSDFFKRNAVYKIDDLEPEYVQDLESIKALAYSLHRSPLKNELPAQMRERLLTRCKSYRNVLYQIGLEPVVRMKPFSATNIYDAEMKKQREHKINLQNCYYQVLNIDVQTERDLCTLYQIWKETEEIPDKKKTCPKLRRRLQKSCGSWANALYQLNYMKEVPHLNSIEK